MIDENQRAARARGRDFDVVRASWLDRQIAHGEICAALDDPWGAHAYAIEADACTRGDTVASWVAELAAASARASPLRATGHEVAGQLARLAVGVPRWMSEHRAGDREQLRTEVIGAAERLLARDADVDLARPRYRWRLPWTGDGLAAFHALLAPLFADARAPTPSPIVPDAAAALASMAASGARFRAQLARGAEPHDFTGDGAVERTPAIVAAELAACRAAVRGECDAMRARDAIWPEPLRAHHARALARDVDAAHATLELDIIAYHAASCFDIEACWVQALFAVVGSPLRMALIADYDPSAETVASVAAARRLARALVGEVDPLRVPWLAELCAGVLAPRSLDASLDGFGSWLGEGGIELLGPWRTWTQIAAAAGADVSAPARLTAARALTATDEASHPAHRLVQLWDEVASLDAADQLRAQPARPPRPR